MANLFLRRVRVTCGDVVVNGPTDDSPGFRVVFNVEKTSDVHPNKATVTIYNLNEFSRGALSRPDLGLQIEAGYVDGFGQIFLGDVRTVQHVQDGPDRLTKITAGDGAKAVQASHTSVCFKAGTSLEAVINYLASDLGVGLGNLPKEIAKRQFRGITEYTHGRSFHEPSARALEKVLKDAGYTYSIQDRTIQVQKIGEAVDAPAVLLNQSTGLIGSPEVGEADKNGKTSLKVRCLLQSGITPSRVVRLESRTRRQEIVPNKVILLGDTHGQEWYCDLECRAR